MILAAIGFATLAGAGTLVRWDLAGRLPRPMGTLLVNLAGTFALGASSGLGSLGATLVGTAALGALTTFSTLMLELVELWETDRRRSVIYGLATAAGGLAAAWLGLAASA